MLDPRSQTVNDFEAKENIPGVPSRCGGVSLRPVSKYQSTGTLTTPAPAMYFATLATFDTEGPAFVE